MARFVNICKGSNFLQEVKNLIMYDALGDKNLSHITIISTTSQISLVLKKLFLQEEIISPSIYSVGEVEELKLSKIFNVTLSNLTKSSLNLVNDNELRFIIYNFLSQNKNIQNLTLNLKPKDVINLANLAMDVFNIVNNQFDISHQINRAKIDLSYGQVSVKLESSLDFIIKLGKYINNFLTASGLETKAQRRQRITNIFVDLLNNSKVNRGDKALYFVGQNGENEMFNKISKAAFAKDFTTIIALAFEDVLDVKKIEIKDFSLYGNCLTKARYFVDLLNPKLSQIIRGQSKTCVTKYLVKTRDQDEQNTAITNLILSYGDNCGKVLILCPSGDSALKLELYLRRLNKDIYNSFGCKLTQTEVCKFYNLMLSLSSSFNVKDFLSFVGHELLDDSFKPENIKDIELVIRMDARLKSVKNLNMFLKIVGDNFTFNQSLTSAFLELANCCGFKNILAQSLKAFKMLTNNDNVEFEQFFNFIETEIASFQSYITELQCLKYVNLEEFISLFYWLADNRNFITSHQKRDKCDILILSLKEARYHSFDKVIIADFIEDSFDKMEHNPLLSDPIKKTLGLATSQDAIASSLAALKDILSIDAKLVTAFYYNQADIVQRPKGVCAFANCFEFTSSILPSDVKGLYSGLQESAVDNIFVPIKYKHLSLSNTSVNMLVGNRFDFYIKYILKLKELETINEVYSKNKIGIIIHSLLAKTIEYCNINKSNSRESVLNYMYSILNQEWLSFYGSKNYLHAMHTYGLKVIFNDLYDKLLWRIIASKDKPYWEGYEGLKTKYYISELGVSVQAIPDLILTDYKTIEIIDYKTSSGSGKYAKSLQMPLLEFILHKISFGLDLKCLSKEEDVKLNYYKIINGNYEVEIEESKKFINFEQSLYGFIASYKNDNFNFNSCI
jgi:hypothetical protein